MSAKKKAHTIKGLDFHGGGWRWRRMVDGRRLVFRLQAVTEDDAIKEVLALRGNPALYDLGAWEHEVTSYIAAGQAAGDLSPRNADNRRLALDLARRKMGVNSPREVTPFMAQRWLAGEQEAHPKSTTPITYLRHMKAFYRHLKRQKKIPFDPFDEMKAPKIQKRLRNVFVGTPDVIRLFEAAKAKGDRDLEFILALGFECGMRRAEISSARAEWFNLAAGTVTVPAVDVERFARKGQEGRRKEVTIPLSEPVLEVLQRHGLPAPFVVVPEKKWGKARYRFDFQKRLKKFLGEHGCGHITIHDLRRSFGSNRVSAGVSIEKVANWMGIDPETAWKHYARFIPADQEINRGAAVRPVKEEAVKDEKGGVAERLRALKGLLVEDLITPEEFAAKRDVILGEL